MLAPAREVERGRPVAATLLDGAPFPLERDDPVKSMATIDAVKAAATSRAASR